MDKVHKTSDPELSICAAKNRFHIKEVNLIFYLVSKITLSYVIFVFICFDLSYCFQQP
jgi:hypothetical protein